MATYQQFTERTVSEKIGLVILEASERALGWTLHSGSVYKLQNFSRSVIAQVTDSGTELTVGASASLSAGQYYHDRENQTLYLRTSDSVNPNGKFIALTFKLFFSTPAGLVSLPHDLSTGYEVEWVPLGVAIEGSGSVKFINDGEFWAPLYDKVYFENQTCLVYSWSRDLAATEAKLLFRGKVQSKQYSGTSINFSLKDAQNALRAPIPLSDMEDYPGARNTVAMNAAKQRRIYGYVYGHRPTNIDEVLQGYPLEGTVSLTNGSATVTGSGTEFLRQVSPEDELLFVTPVGTTRYAVESVTSNTSLTVTSEYGSQTVTGTGVYILPKLPKRYTNRVFLIAGHSLKEPVHQISEQLSGFVNQIKLDSVEDIEAGDILFLSGETVTVQRVFGNRVKLTTNLALPPTVGTTVTRPAVTNVTLGGKLLVLNRDYTYDAGTALLTLDQTAEFNIAPVVSVSGTVSFTNGSRTVTGSSTNFTTQFKPGDWIRAISQSDFFEVLQVVSDTELTLRSAATYTESEDARAKKPEYYQERSSVLTCDVLGATENGTTTGTFLKTVPQIVKDLLILGGLEDLIENTSFATAKELAPQKVGLVIPKKYNDRNIPKLKDLLNELNKSIFGSVIQNSNFQLVYKVLRPVRESGMTRFNEADILRFTVKSLSDKISATVRVRYLNKEYDHVSQDEIFSQYVATSKIGQYLAKTSNETLVETLLVNEGEAIRAGNRWAFLVGAASTVLILQTKMQGSLLNVTDRLIVDHEKLYERVGTDSTKMKIGAIQSARKSFNDCQIEIEDLSNAFSRCGIITSNGQPNYANAGNEERFFGSYITDNYGMQNNDPETYGVNLIW
jgi:hypothetical protein